MSFFTKYELINLITGSYNLNFILQEKFSGRLWIGKFSRSLSKHGVDFKDLDERAVLAYRLSKGMNICIPETKLIKFNKIEYSPLFNDLLKSLNKDEFILNDKILITRFKGITLNNFVKFSELKNIKNLKSLLNNFVFNLWIGNYDKKNEDYVVDNDLLGCSIDYNLLGPGFIGDEKDEFALGGYADAYDLKKVEQSGCAIAPVLKDYIIKEEYGVDFFEDAINKIENMTDETIKKCFKNLYLFRVF